MKVMTMELSDQMSMENLSSMSPDLNLQEGTLRRNNPDKEDYYDNIP
jgi:hypothetical protein